jgi:Fe-S-cluster containining protein
VAAGAFSEWLAGALASIREGAEADVPCGGCTACCQASLFIAVGPEEADTLAHIPAELLFPAPGRPQGHRIMGYDDHGRCPMLVDGACSIYEHRPEACRTYDCRIFAATGIVPDERTKAGVAERASRWRFDLSSDLDRAEHDAVQAAAAYVRRQADELRDVAPTTTDTQQALLALELHGLFHTGPGGERTAATPSRDEVRAALARHQP